jgi:hypothetical protein
MSLADEIIRLSCSVTVDGDSEAKRWFHTVLQWWLVSRKLRPAYLAPAYLGIDTDESESERLSRIRSVFPRWCADVLDAPQTEEARVVVSFNKWWHRRDAREWVTARVDVESVPKGRNAMGYGLLAIGYGEALGYPSPGLVNFAAIRMRGAKVLLSFHVKSPFSPAWCKLMSSLAWDTDESVQTCRAQCRAMNLQLRVEGLGTIIQIVLRRTSVIPSSTPLELGDVLTRAPTQCLGLCFEDDD